MSASALLPQSTLERLLAFCATHDDDPEAVIADAVALHLDACDGGGPGGGDMVSLACVQRRGEVA